MKKLSLFVVALFMSIFVFNQPFAKAESEKQQDTTNFMKSSGIIKEVISKDGEVTLIVETEESEPVTTHFKINNDTLLFNSGTTEAVSKESFEKGQRIDAYYDKNKPMILIYPAQITPELVIVHDDKKIGSVKVGMFDSEFLSLDKELKLNIGKETVLVNEKGEKINKADLSGKELIVFYTITTMSLPPQTPPNKVVAMTSSASEVEQNDFTNYMKSSGIIKNVVSKDGKVTLTVETEEKEPVTTILKIDKDTLLFNSGTTKAVKKESFKKGQRIDAYYDKNKPMLAIYPAQITPELVIVHDSKKLGFVKVSKFDKKFTSLDNELKLNIGKKTVLVDEKGKKVRLKDLQEKELIVFYTVTTRSIPAQTIPSKIVAIDYVSPQMKEVKKITAKDSFKQDGVKMIPLQKIAEYLGYEVNVQSSLNSVSLTLGNSSVLIKLGEKTYGYNKSLRQFAEEPVVKNNVIYVSEDILKILVK